MRASTSENESTSEGAAGGVGLSLWRGLVRRKLLGLILLWLAACILVADLLATHVDVGRVFVQYAADHPQYNLTTVLIATRLLGTSALVILFIRWRMLRREMAARRSAEARADEALTLLRDAIGSISEGFVIFDENDRIVMCNARYCEDYAQTGDPLGLKFEDLVRSGLMRGQYADAFGHEEDWFSARMQQHSCADGNIEQRLSNGRWVLITERRMRNGGVAGLRIDITRLKEVEAALRQSEERFDRAQEIAGIGSWEYNVAANRYVWSKQMYRLRGLDPEKFQPTPSAVAAFLHPDDEPLARQFRDDLKAGIARTPIDVRAIHPNGTTRVLRFEGRAVRDANGVVQRVTGTAQDVTDQRLMQQQLVHAQKMEVIGHLAGGMAHDFNNVLGVVIGNLEFLEDYAATNHDAEELRSDALSAALHGAELTRRLLAFARRQSLRPQRTDVNRLIKAAERILTCLLSDSVRLVLDLDPSLSPTLVDPAQLEAALTNLVSNARDAMPRGGTVTIRTRNIHVSDEMGRGAEVGAGDYVRIDVEDTGTGIPAELLGKVFEPFFTTKEQGKGSGLGLAMVLGFMQQSSGNVTLRSEPGAGTVFSLYLHRIEAHAEDAIPEPPSIARRDRAGNPETILVVEDNAPLRRSTVRHLVEMGYRVFEASDGEVASNLIELNGGINLLFTDVVMPGRIDGIDLAERAIAARPGLACLLTSGFSDIADHEQRLQRLGCELLGKPYRREQLAHAIAQALNQRAA
jgi:PAS domain S-box-containing protein